MSYVEYCDKYYIWCIFGILLDLLVYLKCIQSLFEMQFHMDLKVQCVKNMWP